MFDYRYMSTYVVDIRTKQYMYIENSYIIVVKSIFLPCKSMKYPKKKCRHAFVYVIQWDE